MLEVASSFHLVKKYSHPPLLSRVVQGLCTGRICSIFSVNSLPVHFNRHGSTAFGRLWIRYWFYKYEKARDVPSGAW